METSMSLRNSSAYGKSEFGVLVARIVWIERHKQYK